MRLVPAAHQLDLGRPAGRSAAHQPQRIGEGRPIRLRRGRRLEAGEVLHLAVIAREAIERAGRGGRSDAGQQLNDAEAGDTVARILGKAQDREHVLDVGGFQELQAAELDERDVAPGQLDFERAAEWCEARNSTACALSAMPVSRLSRICSTT